MFEKRQGGLVVHRDVHSDHPRADDGELTHQGLDDVASDSLPLVIRPHTQFGNPTAIGAFGADDDGDRVAIVQDDHGVAGPQADETHLLAELHHGCGRAFGEMHVVAGVQRLDDHGNVFWTAEAI